MYSVYFWFKQFNTIFMRGREHADKNIQLCILCSDQKLFRQLKVMTSQASSQRRSESHCGVERVLFVTIPVVYISLIFLSPHRSKIALSCHFLSLFWGWGRSVLRLSECWWFYLWLKYSLRREAKLGCLSQCLHFLMSLCGHLFFSTSLTSAASIGTGTIEYVVRTGIA